jgi:GNAT superfamily N-acetyltransferase
MTTAPAPAPVTLRAATADDSLCLGVLGLQVFLDTYASGGIRPALAREVLAQFSTAALQARLARDDTRFVVAECEAHLVGFAQWALPVGQPCVEAERPAELERLYVQEPFTRRGIGGVLLHRAEADAAAAGADVMWLTSWVHNRRALSFYARLGYADCGADWYVFEAERHENRVLARRLRGLA